MVKLYHQASYAFIHCLLICKINGLLHGRVSHPHKVHVALCGLFRDLAHLVLCAHAQFRLFLCHFRGVVLIPLTEMVRIVLRSVEEDVHLIFLREIKPAQRAFHTPRISVVAFHASAVFLERIVFKCGDLKLAVLCLVQHLLQRGQPVICSVCILAEDNDVAFLEYFHHMHVILVFSLVKHLSRDVFQRIGRAA